MKRLVACSLAFILVGPAAWAGSETPRGPLGTGPGVTHQQFKKKFLIAYQSYQHHQWDKVISSLSSLQEADNVLRDYVLYYRGRAELETKRCAEAEETFQKIRKDFHDSRWFEEAGGQLEQAEICLGKKRAQPVEPADRCGEMRQAKKIADCLFEDRRYEEAVKAYQGLCDEKKGNAPCLRHLSQAAARSGHAETAIEANRLLMKRFPRSEEAADAPERIAFLYQDAGRFEEARQELEQALGGEGYPSLAENFHLGERLAWVLIRLHRNREALELFDQLLSVRETPRVLYWKGRTLERLGRPREARETFRQLVDVYIQSYYGFRGLEALRASQRPVFKDWWGGPQKIHWNSHHEFQDSSQGFERLEELRGLGLIDEAEYELRLLRHRRGVESLPPFLKGLKKDEEGYSWQRQKPSGENDDYPLPYAEVVFSAARKAGVDPFLLYSMMKQESLYRPTVVSAAGAVGLLQLMPFTARRQAKKEHWAGIESGWLNDPEVNVSLAAAYVRDLMKMFGGNVVATIAAYNAGEKAVSRWLEHKDHLSTVEFIEEIPYTETRDYVRKVLLNYTAYRYLYR